MSEARWPIVRFRAVDAHSPHEGRPRKGRTRDRIRIRQVATGQSASKDLDGHSREARRHTEEDGNIAPVPRERKSKPV